MSETPPAVAMKETLERIEKTLATLVEHQKDRQQLGMLVADCRDTITEAVGVFHSQGADILQKLDAVDGQVTALGATPPRGDWWRCVVCGLGGAALMVGVYLAAPSPPYAQLTAALDQVLVQQYASLPKGVQEQFNAVYVKAHVQPPGQRQGKGKP